MRVTDPQILHIASPHWATPHPFQQGPPGELLCHILSVCEDISAVWAFTILVPVVLVLGSLPRSGPPAVQVIKLLRVPAPSPSLGSPKTTMLTRGECLHPRMRYPEVQLPSHGGRHRGFAARGHQIQNSILAFLAEVLMPDLDDTGGLQPEGVRYRIQFWHFWLRPLCQTWRDTQFPLVLHWVIVRINETLGLKLLAHSLKCHR